MNLREKINVLVAVGFFEGDFVESKLNCCLNHPADSEVRLEI